MDREQLKAITEARLKSAKLLLSAGDYFWSAYTMAMALECALKAMICKTLNLSAYPKDPNQPKIMNFFWSHGFGQLLLLSGLISIFGPTGTNAEAIGNWSSFTKQFSGNWPEIRYNYELQRQFDKAKVEALYKNLTKPSSGVITLIKRQW